MTEQSKGFFEGPGSRDNRRVPTQLVAKLWVIWRGTEASVLPGGMKAADEVTMETTAHLVFLLLMSCNL